MELFQGTYVTVCAYLYEAGPFLESVHHCLLTVVLSFSSCFKTVAHSHLTRSVSLEGKDSCRTMGQYDFIWQESPLFFDTEYFWKASELQLLRKSPGE